MFHAHLTNRWSQRPAPQNGFGVHSTTPCHGLSLYR